MRERFPWAAGLSDAEFATAVLLAGLLPPGLARAQALPEAAALEELLVNRQVAQRGGAWAWRWRAETVRLIRSGGDARNLIASASGFVARSRNDWNTDGRGLRVELNVPEGWDGLELAELVRLGGADSVCVRLPETAGLTWAWPLHVGVRRESGFLADLPDGNPLLSLFTLHDIASAAVRCHLLILDGSPQAVLATLKQERQRPSADAVVFLGDDPGMEGSSWAAMEATRALAGAHGVFVLSGLQTAAKSAACAGLVAFLSHDQPIDTAVFRVAAEQGARCTASATRSLLLSTSVREQARRLARQLGRASSVRVRLDPKLIAGFSVPGAGPGGAPGRGRRRGPTFAADPGTRRGDGEPGGTALWIKAADLGEVVAQRIQLGEAFGTGTAPGSGSGAQLVSGSAWSSQLRPLEFHRESDGAQEVARVAAVVEAHCKTPAAAKGARHLQARIETPAGRAVGGDAPMRLAREFVAAAFIGLKSEEWLWLEQPVNLPEPADGTPLMLDVLFWEPSICPTPQLAQITMRPGSDSTVARFPFTTPDVPTSFSARIAVYYRNRNLQTGRLVAKIGDGAAEPQFIAEAAQVPSFEGLAARPGVGASILLNGDPSGRTRAFLFSDGAAEVAEVPGPAPSAEFSLTGAGVGSLGQLSTTLGRAISGITKDPDKYNSLTAEGTRQLLCGLAQHGSALLRLLCRHTSVGPQFDRAGYIQIVTAHVDDFFPAEYLYDGAGPEDHARVCGGSAKAAQAVESGECCGAYDKDPHCTICPLRFWSLSKVIERHAHLPKDTEMQGQFAFRAAPVSTRDRVLAPLSRVLLGVSRNADAAVPDTVKTLSAELEAVAKNKPVPVAADWTAWAGLVDTHRPSLLILLPHHEQEAGFDWLEIGGDRRQSVLIQERHVQSSNDRGTRPVVLLIGCQTASAKIDLEGFVVAFQDAGAAIVVSTIASVLGRQAGPVAAAIAHELKRQESQPGASFGRVMLEIRRRLLARGCPMVLGLTSHGDADWRIGGGT